MSDGNNVHVEDSAGPVLPDMRDYAAVASELCEKAIRDAKSQLHPLLHNLELHRLAQRKDFLQSFRSAFERGIARTVASWLPDVQAVFRYDEAGVQHTDPWNGSIHLLVKVPALSNAIRTWSKKLDQHLVKYWEQIAWPQLQTGRPVLEVHQVTPHELRHGIGYGAMFFAVYTAPVRVWPQAERAG